MSSARVAIIDIGSNSIKSLVAQRGPEESLITVHSRAIDARISTGISRQHLYRLFKKDANPRINTLLPVLEKLGFRLELRSGARRGVR